MEGEVLEWPRVVLRRKVKVEIGVRGSRSEFSGPGLQHASISRKCHALDCLHLGTRATHLML